MTRSPRLRTSLGGTRSDDFAFFPGGSDRGQHQWRRWKQCPRLLPYLHAPSPINLAAHTATGIGGTFNNINTFVVGSGINILVGPNTPTTYVISGHNTFSFSGFTFINFQSIIGGTANDIFSVVTGGSLDGKIDGGGGTNTLTYSGYSGNVLADLQLHIALCHRDGHLQYPEPAPAPWATPPSSALPTPTSSSVAWPGRNILIGGGGADSLTGSGGDSILIGDGTIFDTNLTALLAISAEWFRTDLSFQQRVADLISPGGNNGSLNGSYTLDKSAIVQDSTADMLVNGTGLAWDFVDLHLDTLANVIPQDHTTVIS